MPPPSETPAPGRSTPPLPRDLAEALAGFAPASMAAWDEAFRREAPGAASGEAGPLATAADLLPGAQGFPAPSRRGPWVLCQRYECGAPEALNRRILADLSRGVGGVELHLPPDSASADLPRILEGVHLPMIRLGVHAGPACLAAAEALHAICLRRGEDPSALHLAFGIDPLAAAMDAPGAVEGRIDPLRMAEELRRLTAPWPHARGLAVSLLGYHAAGAGPERELAFALATAASYLRALTQGGWGRAAVLPLFRFTFAVDNAFVDGVAKLRAARVLWARFAAAAAPDGPPPVAMRLHAQTAQGARADDEGLDLVRLAHAAAAAAMGGADEVTVLPAANDADGDRAARLAANTSAILELEAGLGRIEDPLGGSYAVEARTDALARGAWRRFRDIEAAGGMAAALAEGRIRADLATLRGS